MGPFGDAEGAPLSCCKAQLSFGEIDSQSIRYQNQFFFFSACQAAICTLFEIWDSSQI